MKELKLEDQIYLCKYHDVDKSIRTTMHITQKEVQQLIKYYKKIGVYTEYRNLPDEEYEKICKRERKIKKIKPMQNEEELGKNHLLDLNNILFEELHTLIDDSLTEEQLNEEIKRSKQVVAVSQTIINNADLMLRAKIHYDKLENKTEKIAPLLRLENG